MTPLEAAAARYREARQEQRDASDMLRLEVRLALREGMTESEAARIAGVTRMTVRAWRG